MSINDKGNAYRKNDNTKENMPITKIPPSIIFDGFVSIDKCLYTR